MDNTYKLIGKICADFESLDLVLSGTVSKLVTEDPKVGAIITSEMPFKNLVNAFSSLIQHKYKEQNDLVMEVNKLVKLLMKLKKR